MLGNAQLEDILRGLEGEVRRVWEEVEGVNRGRKGVQEGVRGEVEGLERAWRGGVEGVVVVEVAAEGVRREVLGRRREGGEVRRL